jgi:hypothetical protein
MIRSTLNNNPHRIEHINIFSLIFQQPVKASGRALANMRDSARVGVIDPQQDVTKDLVDAVGLIKRARQERRSLYELLRQPDLQTGQPPSESVQALVKVFYQGEFLTRPVAKDKAAAKLKAFVDQAMQTKPEPGFFGEAPSALDNLRSVQAVSEEPREKGPSDITSDSPRKPIADPVTQTLAADLVLQTSLIRAPEGALPLQLPSTHGATLGSQGEKKPELEQNALLGEPGSTYHAQGFDLSPESVTTDLFPDSLSGLQDLPEAVKGRVKRSSKRSDNDPKSGSTQASAEKSVDKSIEPRLSLRPDPYLPGIYHYSSQLVQVGARSLPVDRIQNWTDAASALAALGEYAVEHFDVLITDQAGKPLAVIGSFKGAFNQASVYPNTLLAEALRIEGAAKAWGVHNHPSGISTLSRSLKRPMHFGLWRSQGTVLSKRSEKSLSGCLRT